MDVSKAFQLIRALIFNKNYCEEIEVALPDGKLLLIRQHCNVTDLHAVVVLVASVPLPGGLGDEWQEVGVADVGDAGGEPDVIKNCRQY